MPLCSRAQAAAVSSIGSEIFRPIAVASHVSTAETRSANAVGCSSSIQRRQDAGGIVAAAGRVAIRPAPHRLLLLQNRRRSGLPSPFATARHRDERSASSEPGHGLVPWCRPTPLPCPRGSGAKLSFAAYDPAKSGWAKEPAKKLLSCATIEQVPSRNPSSNWLGSPNSISRAPWDHSSAFEPLPTVTQMVLPSAPCQLDSGRSRAPTRMVSDS